MHAIASLKTAHQAIAAKTAKMPKGPDVRAIAITSIVRPTHITVVASLISWLRFRDERARKSIAEAAIVY